MGLGLLGRGVGDAKFLAEQGAELIVTDLKTEEQLRSSLDQLKEFPNISYRLGQHDLADFRDRDFILKAAGVPLDSLFIAEARKQHIPIKMSASWFAELAEIPTVGVTGTRGKTTVTYMLYDIMKAAGMKVLLGGNVRGVSTLSLLSEVRNDSVALMELDSWQLQGWSEMSPNVAVFTTFLPDHLNYYKGSMNEYLSDKAQIFFHQKPEDTLVMGAQVVPSLEQYKSKIHSHAIVADPAKFPKSWRLKVPGEHNTLNAMCATEAARALGIDDEVIREALQNYKGAPGRLELVREMNGVQIYNDTTATTPDATIAALKALDPDAKKNIVLIMGGADKGLDMTLLWPEILARCKDLFFLAGSGIDRIRPEAPHVPEYKSLREAFVAAVAATEPGDILLLSPAFASFGMFKNEFDRGDQFNELVASL